MPRLTAPIIVAALAALGCGPDRAAEVSAPTATVEPGRKITVEQIEALARRRERVERKRRGRTPAVATPTPAPGIEAPPITRAFIPFPQERKNQMAAYAQRHYGFASYRLRDPRLIVQHFTATDTAAEAIAIFEPNAPDAELGELPGTCTHFVIDRDGTILQLVSLSIMCRHTVGLNHTAIGIEHAGFTAQEVLTNAAQMRSSLALTRWLQCRFAIDDEGVIGHNENLDSPYHRERVAALRDQTHEDFNAAEMDAYRRRLGARQDTC